MSNGWLHVKTNSIVYDVIIGYVAPRIGVIKPLFDVSLALLAFPDLPFQLQDFVLKLVVFIDARHNNFVFRFMCVEVFSQ